MGTQQDELKQEIDRRIIMEGYDPRRPCVEKMTVVQISLPPSMYDRLRAIATERNCSAAELIRAAVAAWFEKLPA